MRERKALAETLESLVVASPPQSLIMAIITIGATIMMLLIVGFLVWMLLQGDDDASL